MSAELESIAEAWLDQMLSDHLEDQEFVHSNLRFGAIIDRLEQAIRQQPAELQEPIQVAIGYWLESGVPRNSVCAVELISRFRITRLRPVLKQLRENPPPGFPPIALVDVVLAELAKAEAETVEA